jgi:hypothetical protein
MELQQVVPLWPMSSDDVESIASLYSPGDDLVRKYGDS